ncbi:MAG: YHS domain-containing protein, partial [Verrucomicrobiae bacterium]|nr:YHS domain-containing protein [Verrucomicrobiae bacterium]
MAKDPICGMLVDEKTALRLDHQGSSHYFCSESCRTEFRSRLGELPDKQESGHSCCSHGGGSHSDHGQHGDSPGPAVTSVAAKYFCPMCPGVASDKAGDCPKCGMALERNPAWKPSRLTYTCPMHPE